MLVSHEWIMLGGLGVRPWAGCRVGWAGGESVDRVSCWVGRGCVRGPGVRPWAGCHVRWAGGASVGRVGGCRAYVDGETGGWRSSIIRSLRVCNCRDGSSRQPFPFVCWWPGSSKFCPRMTPGPESAVVCVCVCVCVCVTQNMERPGLFILTSEGRFGSFPPAQWDM